MQRAEAQQVTVARLLLESALADDRATATEFRDAAADLFALRRVLTNTANNVNQLARAANLDGRLPFAPAPVIEELERHMSQIDGLLDRLASP